MNKWTVQIQKYVLEIFFFLVLGSHDIDRSTYELLEY